LIGKGSGALSALQWFVFMFANALMLPIVVGVLFDMSAEDIVGLIQRMFFVAGVASFLSAKFGHGLPIADGPAGVWLGAFVLMSRFADESGEALRLLEGGMLFAGLLVTAVGATGTMRKLMRLFTPIVTGVYLILLAIQLCGTLLKGMLFASNGDAYPGGNIAIALLVFLLVFACSAWGRGWVRSYALLIGVALGWLAYGIRNGFGGGRMADDVFRAPAWFAWGPPAFDGGMALSSAIVAFIVISSLVASVNAMRHVIPADGDKSDEERRFRGGALMSGASTMLAGAFSAIGSVPLSISSGFVRTTGQRAMGPFYAASLLLVAVSFVPALFSVLALLPGQIANAVMFALFAQILGIGVKALTGATLDERGLTIVSMSLGLGTAVLFLPAELFATMPDALQYVLGNGLVVGMLVALGLEQLWRERRDTDPTSGRAAA